MGARLKKNQLTNIKTKKSRYEIVQINLDYNSLTKESTLHINLL